MTFVLYNTEALPDYTIEKTLLTSRLYNPRKKDGNLHIYECRTKIWRWRKNQASEDVAFRI